MTIQLLENQKSFACELLIDWTIESSEEFPSALYPAKNKIYSNINWRNETPRDSHDNDKFYAIWSRKRARAWACRKIPRTFFFIHQLMRRLDGRIIRQRVNNFTETKKYRQRSRNILGINFIFIRLRKILANISRVLLVAYLTSLLRMVPIIFDIFIYVINVWRYLVSKHNSIVRIKPILVWKPISTGLISVKVLA